MKHLDHRTITYSDLVGKGKNSLPFAEVSVERCRDYACEDADIALQLAGERLQLVGVLLRDERRVRHPPALLADARRGQCGVQALPLVDDDAEIAWCERMVLVAPAGFGHEPCAVSPNFRGLADDR